VENHPAAFPFLYQALQILPQDPALNRIRREITHPIPIRTSPPGASVYVKPYGNPDSPWMLIGQSPLEDFLLPMGYFRWRITKPGFRTMEGAAGIQSESIDFILDPEGSLPPEMVHVPRGNSRMFNLDLVHTDDFWMDKYEVTNKQFKEFVDKGGYRNRQYWREEFVKDGRVLSWEQAMLEFRDPTGTAKDARSPFDRSPTNGFRCVKYPGARFRTSSLGLLKDRRATIARKSLSPTAPSASCRAFTHTTTPSSTPVKIQ
jgi:eukaryotic-like serine/threonine-protein kinase